MSEWIDVKDRLPEFRVPVLVYRDGYVDGAVLRIDGFRTHAGANCGRVTHWQPLPLPPANLQDTAEPVLREQREDMRSIHPPGSMLGPIDREAQHGPMNRR